MQIIFILLIIIFLLIILIYKRDYFNDVSNEPKVQIGGTIDETVKEYENEVISNKKIEKKILTYFSRAD